MTFPTLDEYSEQFLVVYHSISTKHPVFYGLQLGLYVKPAPKEERIVDYMSKGHGHDDSEHLTEHYFIDPNDKYPEGIRSPRGILRAVNRFGLEFL
jgi:hypothetical protein